MQTGRQHSGRGLVSFACSVHFYLTPLHPHCFHSKVCGIFQEVTLWV